MALFELIGAGIGGGLSLLESYDRHEKEQEAIDKSIKGLEELTAKTVQRSVPQLAQGQAAAADIFTQFSMEKDPNRRAGLRQMYQQQRQSNLMTRADLDKTLGKIDESIIGLESQKGGFTWGEGLQSFASGALGGFMAGKQVGQGLETAAQLEESDELLGGLIDDQFGSKSNIGTTFMPDANTFGTGQVFGVQTQSTPSSTNKQFPAFDESAVGNLFF